LLFGPPVPATGSCPLFSILLRNPPENIAWAQLFSGRLEKNSRGFWEAEFCWGICMVYVPAGDFLMGSPDSEEDREPDEGPRHPVRLPGAWIGKFEVTRKHWHAVLGGSAPSGEAELPVSGVTFRNVEKFIAALNRKSGLEFRLPREAEWERCCRGGSDLERYGPLEKIAWYSGNSGGRAHPVGTKAVNGFGIHDTLGNVWEWCRDWYSASYYSGSPAVNPGGPEQGSRRVGRGGGVAHRPAYLRAAHRNDQDPEKSKPYLGFRFALDGVLR
jgi:formylglycine-generating enzyme required for sulfatase activity